MYCCLETLVWVAAVIASWRRRRRTYVHSFFLRLLDGGDGDGRLAV
jgi:hypothetical protein